MIKRVKEIMKTDFKKVDILNSVKNAIDLSLAHKQDYFPVFDEDTLVGIITYKELMNAHPNRIIADAMTEQYLSVSLDESIWDAKDIFDNNDTDILFVMDEHKLAGVIDRANLFIEICKCYDPLTGLYNSSYLYSNAVKLIEKGQEVSVIFIDANNFGQINKKYGHTLGDMVLKEIALTLKSSISDDGFLCRYGGDEFAILTTFNATECEQFAIHLQNLVSKNSYLGEIKVSIAVGIAGGKRGKTRLQNPLSVICNLINLSSLASTKAKMNENKLQVEDFVDIESIA